jgi:hypothetical protein
MILEVTHYYLEPSCEITSIHELFQKYDIVNHSTLNRLYTMIMNPGGAIRNRPER